MCALLHILLPKFKLPCWRYIKFFESHWNGTQIVFTAYLSWWMCGVRWQSTSWEVLPKKQRLFGLLPGQTVTIILKLTFSPKIDIHRHRHANKNWKCIEKTSVTRITFQSSTTHSWFSILCISSFIWLADEPQCSSSLIMPPSLSEVLTGSSPSFPLKDSWVCLRRQLKDDWLLGTCRDIFKIQFKRSKYYY